MSPMYWSQSGTLAPRLRQKRRRWAFLPAHTPLAGDLATLADSTVALLREILHPHGSGIGQGQPGRRHGGHCLRDYRRKRQPAACSRRARDRRITSQGRGRVMVYALTLGTVSFLLAVGSGRAADRFAQAAWHRQTDPGRGGRIATNTRPGRRPWEGPAIACRCC